MRPFFLLLATYFLFSIAFAMESSITSIFKDPCVSNMLAKGFERNCPDTPCCCPPHLFYARARYTSSKGIGLQKGYTTVELFNGLMGGECGLVFVDLRGHIFDNGKWAANAGIGLRYRFDQTKLVAGGNVYYDYRRNSKHSFHQIGIGYELLGRCLGFRMNGYIPFGDKRKFEGLTFNSFSGNNLILDRNFLISMYGGDIDLFARVLQRKNVDILLGVTPYYFKGSFGRDAWGAKARVEAEFYKTIGGMIRASYDRLFKFNIQGEARLKFSFGPRVKRKKQSRKSPPISLTCRDEYLINRRLTDPIDRQETIVLSNEKKSWVAANPNCGPLIFYFVDNSKKIQGVGSAKNPFIDLSSAQNISNVGDFIYVFLGNGGTTGLRNGITLKDEQSLLGSGALHVVNTERGPAVIPQLSAAKPSITNITLNSNIVTLANDNVVSGFRIIGLDIENTGHGIALLNPLIASTITNNEIIDAGDLVGTQGGVFIDLQPGVAVQNTFVIRNNLITSSEGGIDGIRIDCSGVGGDISANFDMSYNTIVGNSNVGIQFIRSSGTDDCTLSGNISHNDISSNRTDGIFSDDGGGAVADIIYNMVINNNIISGNASEGMDFEDVQGSLFILDNVLTGNGGTAAMFIETGGGNTLNLEVLRNRVTDNNTATGIELQADTASTINATFIGNIATGDDFEFDENGASTIRVRMADNEGLFVSSGNVILEQ